MDRRQFLIAAPLAAPLATSLAAPALAQSRREMVIVSTWPRDYPGLGLSAQRLGGEIEAQTGGRLKVSYFAAGERVGAFDAFDAVAAGDAQAYIGAEGYWRGKHPGFPFFQTVPMGLTCTEMVAWADHLGGQALWDDLAAEYGLKGLFCGGTGVSMGGWFNKEINSVTDFQGLRFRVPGLASDVFSRLGASPASLPPGQIYESLASGVVDGAEWVGPWADYALKLHEAARYYYAPGLHEPGGMVSMGINAAWWAALPAGDRAVIETLCAAETTRLLAEYDAQNGVYLDKLITEHGVELRTYPEEVAGAFAEAAAEVYAEISEHDARAAAILDSFFAARERLGRWKSVSEAAYLRLRAAALGG
ncbi:MAG: TRAP transporter substrate-binding protein [Rhodobacteraceae bacterium]|nr:TRAP transporter substrate-binding protein [Paracoccaceae bacterium]